MDPDTEVSASEASGEYRHPATLFLFWLVIAVQMLNRCQRFCSPGVGDTNTDQQRRKRCENSNLENGLQVLMASASPRIFLDSELCC